MPSGGEETARILWFLALTIAYGAVWLAVGLLCSILFRQTATAAMLGLAAWLFFTIFWGIIAGMLAQALSPVRLGTPAELLAQAQFEQALWCGAATGFPVLCRACATIPAQTPSQREPHA